MTYDVIIIGGGPSGRSCALTLKNSGLKVLLIDKSQFPRDKICGDAIPRRTLKVLKQIAPNQLERFRAFSHHERTEFSRIFLGETHDYKVQWKTEAYTCQRIHFDNFLHEAIKEETSTEILENFKIDTIEKLENGFRVGNAKQNQFYECRILIGADGSQSLTARQLVDFKLSLEDHSAAVRAYYKNVKGLDRRSTEFYVDKKYPNAYLWIFPVAENVANVGVGMLSSKISKHHIKLRQLLKDWTTESKVLQNRLENAERLDTIKGFGLTLGTRRISIIGDNFMLIGDAAALIDPIGGHGIDTAMLSGQLAGEQIITAFQQNNFSENIFQNYEKRLFDIIGKDFKNKTRIMRWSGRFPKSTLWFAKRMMFLLKR